MGKKNDCHNLECLSVRQECCAVRAGGNFSTGIISNDLIVGLTQSDTSKMSKSDKMLLVIGSS